MHYSHPSITKLFLALLSAASVAQAHTWVEQLMVIAPNGTFVGEPGYPRGNIKRDEPGFGDPPMVHLITGAPNDPMCKASQKSPSSQSSTSPRLNAAPGDAIALRFQENGHVTLPESQAGKAENRGDVFVYGTSQPKDDELFNEVHGVWTADGKGGDGRGVLLVKAAYDDGQCYQVNGGAISQDRQKQFAHPTNQLMGADLWCQTDLRLPSDLSTDEPYTLYWVWDWATAPGIDKGLPNGKNETYTTCMDIDSVAGGDIDQNQKVAGGGFIEGQPIENAAVPAQFSKLGEHSPTLDRAEANVAGPDETEVTQPTEPEVSVSDEPEVSASAEPLATESASPAPATSAPTSAPATPTTISPIPGSDSPAASDPDSFAEKPFPSEDSASATPAATVPFQAPSPTGIDSTTGPATSTSLAAEGINTAAPVVSMITVTRMTQSLLTITTTVYLDKSSTSAASPSAPPKMRGRNAVFHFDD